MIAALYVQTNGCYWWTAWIDAWNEHRDARLYAGPYPVVAHPPCERWGRYATGGPAARTPRIKGDDGGCFAAALAAVRRWGGVLEHPEASGAWDHFGLNRPPRSGGWVAADFHGGWTCRVEQGNYGHRAAKATWLYACGVELPELNWRPSDKRLDLSGVDEQTRRRLVKTGICQRLSKRQRAATPVPFRDLLISIARSANQATPDMIHRAEAAGIRVAQVGGE